MEKFKGSTIESRSFAEHQRDLNDIEAAERRLSRLIELNSRFETTDNSRAPVPAVRLGNAVGYDRAFALLGASLGLLPPAAIFIKAALNASSNEIGVFFLLTWLVTAGASATGYFTGKLVGRIVKELTEFSWPIFLLSLPFVGITWGILSGGVGGAFILLIGAIPGAVIGAAVGMAALPAFSLLHAALKDGEFIDKRKLYPAIFAVSGLIAALILGFPSA